MTATMNVKHVLAAIATAMAVTLMSASAASAFVIGPGRDPGLAVDAAGTAYIAWNGPENASTLRFCRLPRAATVCDAGTTTSIAVPADTTAGSRPFVAVVGNRVSIVLFRYPLAGVFVAGTYLYTSPDRGATFGAGVKVGTVPYYEAIVGPGDTMSGVTQAGPIPMTFQNVSLNGSPGPPTVVLSATHVLYSAIGLINATTPLAVFGDGNGNSQVRYYDGTGNFNDVTNWAGPFNVGQLSYPKLAGGPKGLFLLSGDGNGNLFARRWNGTNGFGATATVGPGSTPSKHLFQDAGGRLHAAFQRDSANPLQVVHAVSDDGVTWRSGTVVKQDIGTDGGLDSFRVATAADHIGVITYHAGTGAGDVRVVAVGPDAPVNTPPPAADVVSFATAPKTLRVSKTGRFTYKFLATPLRSGKVSFKSRKKVKIGSKKRVMKLTGKKFTAPSTAKAKVKFKLSKKNLKALKKKNKIAFKVTVTLSGKTFTAKLTLKEPKKH